MFSFFRKQTHDYIQAMQKWKLSSNWEAVFLYYGAAPLSTSLKFDECFQESI